MRNQNFEVPFLAYYRKEYVEPELDITALWKVYHFDAKVSCIILDLNLKLKHNNNKHITTILTKNMFCFIYLVVSIKVS